MISTFDDLLQAARKQAAPQRLLMLFMGAELPPDATEAQKLDFSAGHGGALVPLMCVDKHLDELNSFAHLCGEADGIHSTWQLVLAGALSGQDGQPPDERAVDAVFERWIADIRSGQVQNVLSQTLTFTRNGSAVQLRT